MRVWSATQFRAPLPLKAALPQTLRVPSACVGTLRLDLQRAGPPAPTPLLLRARARAFIPMPPTPATSTPAAPPSDPAWRFNAPRWVDLRAATAGGDVDDEWLLSDAAEQCE